MTRESSIITLDEPIQAHGETVTSLTLRPPKGKDLRIAGYPFRIGGGADSSVTVDAAAISKLISSLSGIPTSSVDLLSAADWQSCMTAISTFLGPTKLASSSTGTTSNADGGALLN